MKNEVGTVESKDTGIKSTKGWMDRHFPRQKGISGDDTISCDPTGARPHTTEDWFRAERPKGIPFAQVNANDEFGS